MKSCFIIFNLINHIKRTETFGESVVGMGDEVLTGGGCCSDKANTLFAFFAGVVQASCEVVRGRFCALPPLEVILATTLLMFDMIV